MLGQRHRIEHVPVGRVGIIATWNYPIQILGIQLVQSLVAGNDVVVKPSEHSPRTQLLLIELAQQAGLPAGTLSVRDASIDAGRRMVTEDRFDHILFTGSTRVGREIAMCAARTLTPTTLELSGCDSALVLADADPALAAKAIWNAVIMNGGQTCMAPRRAYVDRAVYSRFLSALSALAAGAKPVCLITDSSVDRMFGLVLSTVNVGGRSLTGVLESPRGSVVRPIALADCPPDAPLVTEEHFGPALAVVPCDNLDHILSLQSRHEQVLATSVFTRSARTARAVASKLNSSSVTINDCVIPTAHPAAALSGRGASGWGVSRGPSGLLALTRTQHISSTSSVLRTPTEAPVGGMVARLQSMLLRMASW